MVHLIQDEILGGYVGTLVGVPALGIGLVHVNDGTALAIHAYGGGPDARALPEELAVILHVKGVELAVQVPLDGSLPQRAARFVAFHVDGLDGFASLTILIDAQFHLLGIVVGLYSKGARAGGVVNPGASVH